MRAGGALPSRFRSPSGPTLPMLFAPCLALLATPSALPLGDWPCWRGPNRDGIAREEGWSDQGRELWRAELGLGYSSLSLAGGRLVSLGHDEAAEEDVVVCLDAATGEELWSQRWSYEKLANFHGGGTLTTPAIDGAHVWISQRGGVLHKFELETGASVWQRDYASELERARPFHGFSGSPMVLDEMLVLPLGGTTLALDKQSGDVLWESVDQGDGSYGNPIEFELEGRACLAVLDVAGLHLLDRASGEVVREHEWRPQRGGIHATTPIVMGSRVFLSSAYEAGCKLLDLAPDPPSVVWESRRMQNKVCGSVLVDGFLYGFDESMLKCLDLEGNERWRRRGLGMGSLIASDGRLLILSSKGELIIAEATPEEYRERSRSKVLDGGVYWTPPVLSEGRVYCRNSLGQLVCLDHRDEAASGPLAGASEGANEAALPGARALFDAHIERSGGAEALAAIESVHQEGWIEILGAGVTRTTLRVDVALPARRHLAYDLDFFGEARLGHADGVAWIADPVGKTELIEGAHLDAWRETSSPRLALEAAALYPALGVLGGVEFDDRACWAVAAVSKDGVERTFYFERASGLLAGWDGEAQPAVALSDYADFEGVWLPTRRVELAPETGEELTIHIESVSFNAVDPAVFEPPAAIRDLLRTPEEIAAEEERLRAAYAELLGRYDADPERFGTDHFELRIESGRLALGPEGADGNPLAEPDENGQLAFTRSPGVSLSARRDADGAVDALVLLVRGQENVLPRSAPQQP